ncbi:sugar phosphate isomerase/epimerase [Williamsia sp. CHRR-6]|uniref:sugar phosphate isomerase/epimerase family protein n=1 Tax=Williamsia sp. CHRR-6 TaxID=2835871 RepID=UPI001BDA5F25|nr:TIM barrel protein [Williamsia sp. CHRR-6]MBT0567073.1 TIM barrel protein [Williamsia sp. CHRR-6]
MSDLRPGLCSVTLRAQPVDAVIAQAAAAGLAAIEWGGDVHVPPHDLPLARSVAARTLDAGLAVAAYGSYLRLGHSSDPTPVIDTAVALGAPRIRVWAGSLGSADTDADTRAEVVRDARVLADRAAAHGVTIGLEFHGDTLTDTVDSTLELLAEIDRPATLGTYWQPPRSVSDAQALDGLRAVLGHTVAIHAFSWWPADVRHPLARRVELWTAVITLARAAGRPLDVLLEFVIDDRIDQLATDADVLIGWLESG